MADLGLIWASKWADSGSFDGEWASFGGKRASFVGNGRGMVGMGHGTGHGMVPGMVWGVYHARCTSVVYSACCTNHAPVTPCRRLREEMEKGAFSGSCSYHPGIKVGLSSSQNEATSAIPEESVNSVGI